MATFVFAKDYVRFLMTGELATEPTDAGNTYFLDLIPRAWDTAFYKEMGHDPRTLPALVRATDVAGKLTRRAANATGLQAGTPIIAGAADMAASVVGTGVIDPGVVAVTIGTSAQVTAPVAALLPAANSRVDFHPHPCEGLLYLLGSIFSGGLTMQWLAKAFGDEAEAASNGSAYFERLSRDAAQSQPGADGVLFLPFLVGTGSPEFDPNARAAFVGLSVAAGRPQLVRAAMEGVAHDVRQTLDIIAELGVPIERVHLAGGGAASEVWREIIAGVLGRPVFPTRVRDASALGAAALAAVGLKALPGVREAARSMVHFSAAVEPEQRAADRYASDHEVFIRARTAVVRQGAAT
jgi:xylulokinase